MRARRPLVVASLLALLLPSAAPMLPQADGLPVDTTVGPEPYHLWPYLTADLALLAATHPTLAKWTSVGKSVQGLDLWVLEIANFLAPNPDATVIVLDGGTHGNEHLGMEAVYAIAVRLLNQYFLDEDVRRIVDANRIYLLPSLNPDGAIANTRKNANGVDLNRNFPWHWGEAGCSHNPNSSVYCGPFAASEPETRAAMALLEAVRPDIYVAAHTGVTMLIHSWGHTRSPAPDQALYANIGTKFRALDGLRYGQASTTLYIVSGSSKDWAYGTLGALGWTYEVDGEQGNYYSTQDIEKRLAKPLRGYYWLLDNAHRFGADLAAGQATATRAPDGSFALSFTLTNDGFGPASVRADLAVGTAPLMVEGPSQVVVQAAGEGTASARFTVRPTMDGAGSLTLTLGYTRTALLGDPVTESWAYTATVADGGMTLSVMPA